MEVAVRECRIPLDALKSPSVGRQTCRGGELHPHLPPPHRRRCFILSPFRGSSGNAVFPSPKWPPEKQPSPLFKPLPSPPVLALMGSLAPQVFGKGNTAFWIVFSVIHILATLLLSTQLYYMGRWKLGERAQSAGQPGSQERTTSSPPASSQGAGWECLKSKIPKGVLVPVIVQSHPAPRELQHLPLSPDSGTWRRIFHVLYTDCIHHCSGPMYMVRGGLALLLSLTAPGRIASFWRLHQLPPPSALSAGSDGAAGDGQPR